jgi:hypothetical protein
MEIVGLIERANLGGPGGSIVWGTYEAAGRSRPNIDGQTLHYDVAVAVAVAVAAVSARYINAGFAWRRDDRPAYVGGHQADGVAVAMRTVSLIEVELTPERAPRYASIFSACRNRLEYGEAGRIAYLCNVHSGRAVRAALNASPAGRSIASRVEVRDVFDARAQLAVVTSPSDLPLACESEIGARREAMRVISADRRPARVGRSGGFGQRRRLSATSLTALSRPAASLAVGVKPGWLCVHRVCNSRRTGTDRVIEGVADDRRSA